MLLKISTGLLQLLTRRKHRIKLIKRGLFLIFVLTLLRCVYVEGSFFLKVATYHFIKYLLVGGFIWWKLRLLLGGVRYWQRRKLFLMLGLVLCFTSWDTINWSDMKHNKLLSSDKPKYFISSNFNNNEAIFNIYSYEVERFIEMAGAENVFISIIEYNSTDSTPKLLRTWSEKLSSLKVSNKIITDFKLPNRDAIDQVEKLAYIRNAALQPFFEPENSFIDPSTINWNYTIGEPWVSPNLIPGISRNSKVIFLSDVLFFKESIIKLINTNEGDYDAVCGTDYDRGWYYNHRVARDLKGKQILLGYPYFTNKHDQQKLLNQDPIEMYSCWSGMVVFNMKLISDYFNPQLLTTNPFSTSNPISKLQEHKLEGIRFRTKASPTECYASECFYIWYDLHIYKPLPLKIYQNPGVILYNNLEAYFRYREYFNWFFIRWCQRTKFNPNPNDDTNLNSSESKYQCWQKQTYLPPSKKSSEAKKITKK